MGEDISRLMDGELPDGEVETVCSRLHRPDGVTTWVCYHVIGDALRGSGAHTAGFAQRFAARLAVEPTVLGAQTSARESAADRLGGGRDARRRRAWSAGSPCRRSRFRPRARQGPRRRRGARRAGAPPRGPADYLLAHQEYSPTTQIQGVDPDLRAVSASPAEPRP